MADPILSILIPTVVGREANLDNLLQTICKSIIPNNPIELFIENGIYYNRLRISNQVEFYWILDAKQITIGEKREMLYKGAHGLYSFSIDDDDSISDNAIQLIIDAIKQEPDCITFEEHIDIDGKIEKSNHSLTYGDWEGEGGKELWDGFHYHRTPFFKSVIRTDIARSVPIPHIRWAEDHQWSQALKPHLKTEIHIPEQLYRYIHVSSPHNIRYGIK